MKFIKLILVDENDPVFLNTKTIMYLYRDPMDEFTVIVLHGDYKELRVVESCEQVMKLCERYK